MNDLTETEQALLDAGRFSATVNVVADRLGIGAREAARLVRAADPALAELRDRAALAALTGEVSKFGLAGLDSLTPVRCYQIADLLLRASRAR